MKKIAALLKKDLLSELRAKEVLVLLVSLALLFSVIVAVGVNSSSLNPETTQRIFPMLLWVVFVLGATISIGKSLDMELRHMAIEGLLLTGISPAFIFLAKLVSNTLLILVGHLVSFVALSILLNVDTIAVLPEFLILSTLVVIGYAALSTLLSGIAASSKLKGFLLPILLIPLLFPLFFSALELSFILFIEKHLLVNSIWLSLLIGLDVLYILLGLNLFQHVIRE